MMLSQTQQVHHSQQACLSSQQACLSRQMRWSIQIGSFPHPHQLTETWLCSRAALSQGQLIPAMPPWNSCSVVLSPRYAHITSAICKNSNVLLQASVHVMQAALPCELHTGQCMFVDSSGQTACVRQSCCELPRSVNAV